MSIQTIAKRNTNEEIIQANFRLPKTLLDDLKELSSDKSISQTLIVEEALREKINQYRLIANKNLSLQK